MAAQAMQFAAGGDAQGGIVALALTKAPEVARLGTAVPLPATMHKPLRQRMVLLRSAGPWQPSSTRGCRRSPRARSSCATASRCPASRSTAMDWTALRLSLALAAVTLAVLLPLGVVAGRWLATTRSRGSRGSRR